MNHPVRVNSRGKTEISARHIIIKGRQTGATTIQAALEAWFASQA